MSEGMSEDEIIDSIELYLRNPDMFFDNLAKGNMIRNIQGLLDLYQKEKEKNFIFKNATIVTDLENDGIEINMKADDLVKLYLQEKEKNKELTDEYMIQKHLINPDFLKDYISKDKIRDKQIEREFELQQEYKDFEDDIQWKTYKELLEEE